jgi:hypothetical protein
MGGRCIGKERLEIGNCNEKCKEYRDVGHHWIVGMSRDILAFLALPIGTQWKANNQVYPYA